MAVKDLVADQDILLKLGCFLVTLMMVRLEPYVQLAIDFYMFRGVISEVEVLVCYLRTLSK